VVEAVPGACYKKRVLGIRFEDAEQISQPPEFDFNTAEVAQLNDQQI